MQLADHVFSHCQQFQGQEHQGLREVLMSGMEWKYGHQCLLDGNRSPGQDAGSLCVLMPPISVLRPS